MYIGNFYFANVQQFPVSFSACASFYPLSLVTCLTIEALCRTSSGPIFGGQAIRRDMARQGKATRQYNNKGVTPRDIGPIEGDNG